MVRPYRLTGLIRDLTGWKGMHTEEEHRLIRGNTTYSFIHTEQGWTLEVRHTVLGVELPLPGTYPIPPEMEAVLVQYEEDGHTIREVHLQKPEGDRYQVCDHCEADELKWFREILSRKIGLKIRKK
jgi:hypothetical protein